jgi:hypothetical protein
MVLGSHGAIGKYLMDHLSNRIGNDSLSGVDVVFGKETVVNKNSNNTIDIQNHRPDYAHAEKIEKLPENILYKTDIFLGVVGRSIMHSPVLEKIILKSEKSDLFFVSGSTKTAEFTDLSEYLRNLQVSDNPAVGGIPVRIQIDPIRDPQTSVIQGSCVKIIFSENKSVNLHLLGGLTPINFLYYGVPTETMDPVLAQLLQLSGGFIKNHESGVSYKPMLHAIDYEITADAYKK